MKPANFAPVYAGLYPELAEIARSNGYAMAVHGTMGRDADLVCIPWVDSASDPQKVVDDILAEFAFSTLPNDPTTREHGRIIYTLAFAGECFIDLSFTTRRPTSLDAERVREDERDRLFERTLVAYAHSGRDERYRITGIILSEWGAMLPADRAALRQKEGSQ